MIEDNATARSRKHSIAGRLQALFLVLIFSLQALLIPVQAMEANTEKVETSRDIAIVFDNSGSMYYDDTETSNNAWCRAIYSMEVFASMLNDGDTLTIYPMNPISVNGSTYNSKESLLQIKGGQDDPAQIRQIQSECLGYTPIDTIDDAYNGLQNSKADEQWLIVITDGATFNYPADDGEHEASDHMDASETVAALSEKLSDCNNSVRVMYLGIGKDAARPTVSGSMLNQVETAAESSDILSTLTSMCNNIFGRDQMEVNGSSIDFDVSLSKLIVFVQGSDISGVSLSGPNGACSATSTRTPSYGTLGAKPIYASGGTWPGSEDVLKQVDSSLSGTLVTFENLDAGSYTLSYSGDATSVNVYYEPDVKIQMELKDSEGNIVADTSEVTAGDYQLCYSLVDKDNNETTSALLGNTEYTVSYDTGNGDVQTITSAAGGEVPLTLEVGDQLSTSVEVHFLNGYTATMDNVRNGWQNPITILPDSSAFQISLDGGEETYHLSSMEEEQPYQLGFTYLGQQLSGDELDKITWTATTEGGNAVAREDHDGNAVSPDYYNGAAADTDAGTYTLTVTAEYEYEPGKTVSNSARKEFTIEDDSNALLSELDIEQSRYTIGSIESGEPLVMNLSLGAEALTAEQLDMAANNFKLNGFPEDSYSVVPLYEESALQVNLKRGDSLKTGNYELNASTTTTNNVGEVTGSESAGKIKVRRLPAWVIPLLIFLLLLLIAALIAFYLTRKVLPKSISVDDESVYFKVGPRAVPGNVTVNYAGRCKKTGSVSVLSPQGAAAGGAVAQVKLDLVAVDARYKKKRRAGVRAISVTPFIGGNLDIDGAQIKGDKNGTPDLSEYENAATITNISDGSGVSMNAKTSGTKGTKVNFSYNMIIK